MLWIDWLVALSVARLVGCNELGLLSLLVGWLVGWLVARSVARLVGYNEFGLLSLLVGWLVGGAKRDCLDRDDVQPLVRLIPKCGKRWVINTN